MTVLVTGAAGFIGFHVARALLARGEAVIGLDAFTPYYDVGLKRARAAELARQARFHLVEADFALPGALAPLAALGIARIVHLGAQPGVRHSIENPQAYLHSNLAGHLALLEFARHTPGLVHMVYASSSSVYGANQRLPFAVEDRTDHPVSLYAATKRADELMSETYAHLYRIPLTGLRFFTVYGPWGRPDMAVWSFTEALYAGRPIRLFAGGNLLRDFTFIDDIVAGILAVLDRPPADDGALKPGGSRSPHALYNIGNNRPERVRDLLALLEAETGLAAYVETLPMQPGDMEATFADISALERATGFRPATPLAEGIASWVAWYRDVWRTRQSSKGTG
ncbi:NAD-dependent epimerase/dehydratase family protein [Thermaurantiacus sp.]